MDQLQVAVVVEQALALEAEPVEIAELPGWVGVRDSKLGTASPVLAVSSAQWRSLLAHFNPM